MGMTQFDDKTTNARVDALHKAEEERLVQTLAPRYGYPYVNLSDVAIDMGALKLIPEETARRVEIVAFELGNESVSVAIRNPKHPEVGKVLSSFEAKELKPKVYMVSKKIQSFLF